MLTVQGPTLFSGMAVLRNSLLGLAAQALELTLAIRALPLGACLFPVPQLPIQINCRKLAQSSAHCGPPPKSGPPPRWFCILKWLAEKSKEGWYFVTPESYVKFKSTVHKVNFMGTQTCASVYICTAMARLSSCSHVVWPTELKCSPSGPSETNFANPWLTTRHLRPHPVWPLLQRQATAPKLKRLTLFCWIRTALLKPGTWHFVPQVTNHLCTQHP